MPYTYTFEYEDGSREVTTAPPSPMLVESVTTRRAPATEAWLDPESGIWRAADDDERTGYKSDQLAAARAAGVTRRVRHIWRN